MKLYLKLGVCLFVYLLFGVRLIIYSHAFGDLFFVWNVFLAFMPLLFVNTLKNYLSRATKKKSIIITLAVLWLLFFPNAPYMITDLIYFGNTTYVTNGGYTTNIFIWGKLVYIGFGILFGSLMGLKAFFEMHKLIDKHYGKKIAYLAIVVTSLLSGFAIYLGRMLRFNSWDVLRPVDMLVRIKDELSAFSIKFSLLFAAYTLGSYILFYVLFKNNGNEKIEDK